MAVTYGFYNSLNKDRVYDAEQMSAIFDGIITDGVFSAIGDGLMPIAGTGMQVIVKTGKCWFNSTWTLNDALLPLDIDTADVSLTRIDAIVVEINSATSTRANSIKIIKGTPSANPAKPTLSNTATLHQYALGYVTVAAGVTSINAGNIEVNVGKTGCPFITSVLQQTSITDLFNQWESEFLTWFNNVQSQLSGDVAANLQNQIDAIVQNGYGKNGVVASVVANSDISELYSGLDTLLNAMSNDEEKRFKLSAGSPVFGGGTYEGTLRKHATGWATATLYGYWEKYPLVTLTRNGTDDAWHYQSVTRSCDLGGKFRVGDVRHSLTGLDAPNSDWHECDGDYFDPTQYSQLADLCGTAFNPFVEVQTNSVRTILNNLKPENVNDRDWTEKIAYIYQLQKYYAYGYHLNGSSGTYKCVIYDPKTLEYEVFDFSDGSTYLQVAYNNGFSDLCYNSTTGKFYCRLEIDLYGPDDDDAPTSNYEYVFSAYESSDGYNWTKKMFYNPLLASIYTYRVGTSKYKSWLYVFGGKIHLLLVVPTYDSSTSSISYKLYFFRFDDFTSANLSSFTLADAVYSVDISWMVDDYGPYLTFMPVVSHDPLTEELFIRVHHNNSSSSSARRKIDAMYRITPSGVYSSLPVPFINQMQSTTRDRFVYITPIKIDATVYSVRIQNDNTSSSSTVLLGQSPESYMADGRCSSLYGQDTSESYGWLYRDPTVNPQIIFAFGTNSYNVQWWPYPAPGSAVYTKESNAKEVPDDLINDIIIMPNGNIRLVSSEYILERKYIGLRNASKYPSVSISGLKTFVRQIISEQ